MCLQESDSTIVLKKKNFTKIKILENDYNLKNK